MKISIVLSPEESDFSPMFFCGNLEYGIKKAYEYGYDGVELNIRDSKKINQKKIVELTESYNLKVVSFGTGQAYYGDGISLASSDDKIQKMVLKRIMDHIDFAGKVGAQVVLGSIRGKYSTDVSIRKKEEQKALETVKKCAKYAEDQNIILTLEPINKKDTNFINNMDEAIEYKKLIGFENIKLLADTYQMYPEEKSIEEAITKAKNDLVHIHLVDTDRKIPGYGLIDFKSILKTLIEIEYNGFLSAEIIPIPNDESAAEEYIKNVRKILAEISRNK